MQQVFLIIVFPIIVSPIDVHSATGLLLVAWSLGEGNKEIVWECLGFLPSLASDRAA